MLLIFDNLIDFLYGAVHLRNLFSRSQTKVMDGLSERSLHFSGSSRFDVPAALPRRHPPGEHGRLHTPALFRDPVQRAREESAVVSQFQQRNDQLDQSPQVCHSLLWILDSRFLTIFWMDNRRLACLESEIFTYLIEYIFFISKNVIVRRLVTVCAFSFWPVS